MESESKIILLLMRKINSRMFDFTINAINIYFAAEYPLAFDFGNLTHEQYI